MNTNFRTRMLSIAQMLYCTISSVTFILFLFKKDSSLLLTSTIFGSLMLLCMFTIVLYIEYDDEKVPGLATLIGFLLSSPIIILLILVNRIVLILKGGDDDE